MNNYTLCILVTILLIVVYLSYRMIQGNVLYARILIDEEGLKPFRKEYCKRIDACAEFLEKNKQQFDVYKLKLGLSQAIEEGVLYPTMCSRVDAIAHIEFERMSNIRDINNKLDFVLAYLREIDIYEQTCWKLENAIFTRWNANDYVKEHFNPVKDIYGYDAYAFKDRYPIVTVKSNFGSLKFLVDYKVVEAIIKYAEVVGGV